MNRPTDVPDESALRPTTPRPSFLRGEPTGTYYGDESPYDLLTGGCGASGLQDPTPPGIGNPLAPTAEELRRLAIYTNYRAIIDTTPGGGYGVLFGPAVNADGTVSDGPGKIGGWEYVALADDERPRDELGPAGIGPHPITLMLQIPESFDPDQPRIIAAPSSGSRGIYGAIGAVGEWGLKSRFAVAYCDKGTGIGLHNLQDDSVTLVDGRRASAIEAGAASHFTALSGKQLDAYRRRNLYRVAYKHAHSRANPEQAWGRYVVMAIDFALYVLNAIPGLARTDRQPIGPANAIIIASGISNGGAASLRAAEQFGAGKIGGVVVSEPNINPTPDRAFGIRQGNQAPLVDHSRPMLDYTTLINIYQACASLAYPATQMFGSPERCASLARLGLLRGTERMEQLREAQAEINRHGILAEQNHVQAAIWGLSVPLANAVTYTCAYGRLSVDDPVCGYSFATTDPASGAVVAPKPEALARAFGASGGIPPDAGTGVAIVNDRSVGGPRENSRSISPSTGAADQNLDGALRLRSLFLGRDAVTQEPLTGRDLSVHLTIRQSVESLRASASLHGIPTIIVHGRNDSVIAPNHSSRPYYAMALKQGGEDNVRYYEIENAHHFDAFNGFRGHDAFKDFAERYIPLHWYLTQSLDLMLAHLTAKALGKPPLPLPPSQLVRTTPRGRHTAGGQLVDISPDNALEIVPLIPGNPPDDLRITFADGILHLPDPEPLG